MGWLSVVLTLGALILVLLQGISLFWRSRNAPVKTAPLLVVIGRGFMDIFWSVEEVPAPYASAGGVLNLFLATGGLVAFLLFHNGALIANSEYGVLLVQGPAARVAVYCVLVMISLAAGVVWQTARLARKMPSHFVWISLLGIAIGIAAAFQVRTVNPDDPAPFCIRFYDMWWPPLLLWIIVCLSQWIAITIGVRELWARGLWGLFFATSAAFMPIRRSLQGLQYAAPSSEPIWKTVVCFGVPAFMAASAVVLTKRWRWEAGAVITGLSMLAGLASAVLWMRHSPALPWFLAPWMLFAIYAAIFATLSIPRWRSGDLVLLKNRQSRPALPENSSDQSDAARKQSWILHLLAIIALAAIGWGAADLTYSVQLDPAWDLSLLIFGWIIFLEMIAERPLADIAQWTGHETRTAGARLLQSGVRLRKSVARTDASTGQEGASHTSGDGFKLSWIVKLVMILVALTIIGEIPNKGKIIVQPFDVLGIIDQKQATGRKTTPGDKGKDKDTDKNDSKDDKRKEEMGKAVSDRIANTLALIGEEMPADVLTLWTGSRPRAPKTPWISATSQEADALHSTVKSSDLKIPGIDVRVPLGFLTLPIQGPMRRILGAEEIQGTIENDNNEYAMLATSSTGDAWRTPAERSKDKDIWRIPNQFLKEPRNECAPEELVLKRKSAPPPPPVATDETNPADALAYMIVSSDDRLLQLGMSQYWRAVQPFLEGMAAWKKFDQTKNYEFLTQSIALFRLAICKDPNFSLAYYRLGRALTADGAPAAAAEAFRASLKANPTFVAAHVALANLLYDFDDSYYMPGAEVMDQPAVPEDAKCRNREEAMSLWRRVIQDLPNEASVADQATAYAGLCHSIMTRAEQELDEQSLPSSSSRYDHRACRTPEQSRQEGSKSWIGSQDQESRYAALFYCRRAEILYSRLPFVLRRDDQVRDARASALTQIGEILNRTPNAGKVDEVPRPPQPEKAKDWSCEVGEFRQDAKSKQVHWLALPNHAYTDFARSYYEQAKVIQPDDWKARCYFALSSQALGHDAPMNKLRADSSMHNVTGNAWWRLAGSAHKPEEEREKSRRYTMALVEFNRAIDLLPENVRSLNDFAYTVWQWHLTSRLPVEELQLEFEREFEHEFNKKFTGWQPERDKDPVDSDRDTRNMDDLAEQYARKAVALTKHGDVQRSFTMRSTLQEVLLAEAFWDNHKPQEALTTLQKDGEDAIPRHAYFDELRWDLAQARLCTGSGPAGRREASELLNAIKANEQDREVQPYTDADNRVHLLAAKCQLERESSNPAATRSVARKPQGAKPDRKRPKQIAADSRKLAGKQSP